jgi:hypothetical protein
MTDYLVETADRCIRTAKLQQEAAKELESIARDLLAKAVELDTERQKANPGSFGP